MPTGIVRTGGGRLAGGIGPEQPGKQLGQQVVPNRGPGETGQGLPDAQELQGKRKGSTKKGRLAASLLLPGRFPRIYFLWTCITSSESIGAFSAATGAGGMIISTVEAVDRS